MLTLSLSGRLHWPEKQWVIIQVTLELSSEEMSNHNRKILQFNKTLLASISF